jgi:hypothetical protein
MWPDCIFFTTVMIYYCVLTLYNTLYKSEIDLLSLLFATGSIEGRTSPLNEVINNKAHTSSFVIMLQRPGHLINSEKSGLRADNCRPWDFFPFPPTHNHIAPTYIMHEALSPRHVGNCPQQITFYTETSAVGKSTNALTYRKAIRRVCLRWSIANCS